MPYKVCHKCQTENGVRSRRCNKCDAAFAFKVKSKNQPSLTKTDWRELKKGDKIKVISGAGPHVIIDEVKHYIGVKPGIYNVYKLDDSGIHLYDSGGHSYLQMIEPKKSLGIYEKYKIRQIRNKQA